jgi:hypothetical protein
MPQITSFLMLGFKICASLNVVNLWNRKAELARDSTRLKLRASKLNTGKAESATPVPTILPELPAPSTAAPADSPSSYRPTSPLIHSAGPEPSQSQSRASLSVWYQQNAIDPVHLSLSMDGPNTDCVADDPDWEAELGWLGCRPPTSFQ